MPADAKASQGGLIVPKAPPSRLHTRAAGTANAKPRLRIQTLRLHTGDGATRDVAAFTPQGEARFAHPARVAAVTAHAAAIDEDSIVRTCHAPNPTRHSSPMNNSPPLLSRHPPLPVSIMRAHPPSYRVEHPRGWCTGHIGTHSSARTSSCSWGTYSRSTVCSHGRTFRNSCCNTSTSRKCTRTLRSLRPGRPCSRSDIPASRSETEGHTVATLRCMNIQRARRWD